LFGKSDYLGAIPCIKTASVTAGQINAGGLNPNQNPFGSRSVLNVTFQDFAPQTDLYDTYADTRTEPINSFWGSFIARHKYFTNNTVKVYDGYVGDELADMQVREYRLEYIQSPNSNGLVSLKAVDPLKVTGDIPRDTGAYFYTAATIGPGNVTLASYDPDYDFGTTDTTTGGITDLSTLTGYTGDDVQFQVSLPGTDVGTDPITGASLRQFSGISGPSGVTINARTKFVRNAQFWLAGNTNDREIIKNLLIVGSGLSSTLFDTTQWQSELAAYGIYPWNPGATYFTEPKPVTEILSGLCRDRSYFLYWDELDSKIKLKVLRDADGTETLFTDDQIIAKSITWKRRDSERITRCTAIDAWPDNPISSTVESSSQSSTIDDIAEGVFEYGDVKPFTFELQFPFYPNNSQQYLLDLSEKYVRLYRDGIDYVVFDVDKADAVAWTGDIIRVSSWTRTGADGQPETVNCRVISADEYMPGARVKYTCSTINYFTETA
jgi:hypothetical protein